MGVFPRLVDRSARGLAKAEGAPSTHIVGKGKSGSGGQTYLRLSL